MRVLGHAHVGGQRRLGVFVRFACAIDHGHLGVAKGLELARLHGFFDACNVEERAGVAFGRHHVFVVDAAFGVVLVGGCELAVKRGGHQVAVAVEQHLPAHFHRFSVHAGKQRMVLFRCVGVLAVVGQRDGKFTAAKHARGVVDGGINRVALVRENAVKALHVGQVRDLVADEVIKAYACDTGVDLVVDPGVAAVVVAVFVRSVRVVRVGNRVLQAAIGLGAHDFLGLVGDAPANQCIGHKAGNTVDFTTRGQAQNAHVASVAAAPDAVIGVKFAGLEVGVVGRARMGGGGCRYRTRGCGGGGVGGLVVTSCYACGQASQCCGIDETATADADGFCSHFSLITHGSPL